MDPHPSILNLVSLLVLLAVQALFVAAQASLAGVRRARVEHLLRERRWGARGLLRALDQPQEVAAAAQLGAALSAVGLGFLVQATLSGVLQRWSAGIPVASVGSLLAMGWVAHAAALALALVLAASLQVVLAQQLPTVLSEQRAEAVALAAVPPVRAFAALARPLTRALSALTALATRAAGLAAADVHARAATPAEIQALVERSQEGGEIEPEEEQLIKGVFQFGDLVAREVMTPRRDVVALPVDASREAILDVVLREGHSRVPVYEGSLDEIVGILLARDLIPALLEGSDLRLRDLVREPCFVPDTKPVSDVLAELRSRGTHMAVVLDEFGGTEGVVTLEDLLEPIVGEIYDEYDVPEPEEFSLTADGDVLIDGGVGIGEVNERYALQLPEGDFDTLGGFIFGELGRLPVPGDHVSVQGTIFRVEQTEDRRVLRVRMITPRREEERQPARAPFPAAPEQAIAAD